MKTLKKLAYVATAIASMAVSHSVIAPGESHLDFDKVF